MHRSTLESKKAEEYFTKAYENGNNESLCELLLMYMDLSRKPYTYDFEYRESEERVDFFIDWYNKKLRGFTEEEAKEKINIVKTEIKRIRYNCDLLDF